MSLSSEATQQAINMHKQIDFMDKNPTTNTSTNTSNNDTTTSSSISNATTSETKECVTMYFYPTIVTFPLIVVIMMSVFGNYTIINKFCLVSLLMLSLVFYVCQIRQIDVLTVCKKIFTNKTT